MSLAIDEIVDARITVLSVLEDDGFDLLARALGDVGCERILVLYDPGAIAVARALAADHPPSTSLAAWKERASKLLSAYRPSRDRMVFASAAAAEAEPKQFRASVSRYFKIPQTIGAIRAPAFAPVWSAWQLMLAAQALAADAEAVLLDSELEAAALPLSPISLDTDEAFSELQAAASTHALLLRQLTNVRREASEHFLTAARLQATHATAVEKPDRAVQSDKSQSADNTETPISKPSNSAAIVRPAPTVGQIVMDQYFSLEEINYSHYDISLYDAKDREMSWEHVKFKFCSWNGKEYLEFRRGPSVPRMFNQWPGQQEDQYGPYINYPDPNTGQVVEISDIRDRRLIQLVFNVLEKAVDAALSAANAEGADKSEWLAKASRLTTRRREAMASWDVGEKATPLAAAAAGR